MAARGHSCSRALLVALAALLLWPGDRTLDVDAPALSGDLRAEVVSIATTECRTPQASDCRMASETSSVTDRGISVRAVPH